MRWEVLLEIMALKPDFDRSNFSNHTSNSVETRIVLKEEKGSYLVEGNAIVQVLSSVR